MNRTRLIIGFLLVLALGFTGLLFGQSDRGTISGVVSDSSGAVVPDATVTVMNVKTDSKTVAKTGTGGSYTVPQLPAGTYKISVEKQGFKLAVRENFPLLVGQTTRADITLEVGQVSQTVEVEAAAPQLKPETSELSTSVGQKQIQDLPLPMSGEARSPINFIALVPGVTGAQSGGGYGNNTTGRTFATSVNGGQTFAFEIQVDGATVQNTNVSGDFRNIAFPQDAVQEFKVETGNFAAEYGRTGGGIVSFTTRSGTNDYHGSVYDYFRNNVLDARGFYAATRPKLNQNEFGGNIGGPVIIPKLYNGKNKTFFFFYYDGFRYRSGAANFLVTVPTQLQRGGDFSDLRSSNGTLIPIYDPTTTRTVNGQLVRDQFPGNVIPANRISSVAKNIIGYVPTPNYNGTSPFDNYASTQGGTNDTNMWGFKIDQMIGTKHRLSGYWGQNKFTGIDAAGAGALSGPVSTAGVTEHPQKILRLNWDYFIRPNLINHGTFGFNRSTQAGVPLVYDKDYNPILGITGTEVANGFPRINFSEIYTPYGSGGGENTNIENGFVGADNVTWIKGNHSFKFGGEMRKNQENIIFNGSALGNFGYSTLETGQPNVTGTGSPLASFMLGLVNNGNMLVNNTVFGWRYEYYSLFFQDTYKMTPKLTLNYGLRWEVPVPKGEAYDRMSNFDPNIANPAAGGIPGALDFTGTGTGQNGQARFYPAAKNEFGPRVGIAYQLKPTTVVRAAYGIYYVGAGSVLDNGERTSSGIGYYAYVNRNSLNNGITPAFQIDNGFPQNFIRPPSLDPSFQNNSTATWMEPGSQNQPYVQNWNLNVQHQFGKNLLLDVAYVGNHGTHMPSNVTVPDQVNPSWLYLGSELSANISCLSDGKCPNAAAAGVKSPYPGFNSSIAQALRPYPQYAGVNNVYELAGFSTYNALQVKLEKRFANDFNFLVSYTAAKTMDLAGSQFAAYFSAGAQDSFNRLAEKSVSENDIPQSLVFSYNYELPFGPGKKFATKGGVAGKFTGGWSFSGIQTYQSGYPLWLRVNNTLPIFNARLRPNANGSVNKVNSTSNFDPNRDQYLNPAAFSGPAPFAFGNAARTYTDMRGFAYYNEDFSIIKRTPFSEAGYVEFRMDMFNAFNRVWFGSNVTSNWSSGNYGKVSGQANGPRLIQFALRVSF